MEQVMSKENQVNYGENIILGSFNEFKDIFDETIGKRDADPIYPDHKKI